MTGSPFTPLDEVVSSFRQIDTRDISNLMGRAGFTLLTIDTDEVQVAYPSMWELMEDLQDMGESNAVINRLVYCDLLTSRHNLLHDQAPYYPPRHAKCGIGYLQGSGYVCYLLARSILLTLHKAMHGNDDGSVPATFQIIYMVSYALCRVQSPNSYIIPTDRVEAFPYAAKALGEGHRQGEPERSSLRP